MANPRFSIYIALAKTQPPKTVWKHRIWKCYIPRVIDLHWFHVGIHHNAMLLFFSNPMMLLQISMFYFGDSRYRGLLCCPVPWRPSGLMSVVMLLEMSLIVKLACVSKGTWYLVLVTIMILWISCIYFWISSWIGLFYRPPFPSAV